MQRRFVQPYCIFFRRTSSETAVSAHGDQTGTIREFPPSGTLYHFMSHIYGGASEVLRTCKKNMCLEKIRCPLVRAPRAGGAPGRRPPATCVKNRGARGKINIKIYGGALYQKRKSPRGTAGGPRELPGRRDSRCE